MTGRAGALRRLIAGEEMVVAPGVFSPSVARLAEKGGFRAAYLSGAAYSNLMALPDLGVTTLTEVARATSEITSRVSIPLIVDVDTGFGEAVNVMRTVATMIGAGASAIHIEDQVLPKKCGHLEGKELVATEEMMKKLITAKDAAGTQLLIIARTDARSVEGLDSAVERARAYSRAGADMIFPEALEGTAEFAEFRKKVAGPLMANMTEFGKTPYITASEFERLGYDVLIFPVTAFRAAMKAVERTFSTLSKDGTQKDILGSLMTREQVDELIDYGTYEQADRKALKEAKRLRGRRQSAGAR